LRFNDAASRMEIAPLETDHAITEARPRQRMIPPPLTARKLSKSSR
jgi:hypothetical protein